MRPSLFIYRKFDVRRPKSRCYTTVCRAQSLSLEQPSISEEKCIAEINRVRQEHGLRPLKAWKELSNCARGHSQNMALNKCSFGHDGFDKRAKQMQKQATLASFAENVAYSYNYDDPIKVAVDGWMKSPGNRKIFSMKDLKRPVSALHIVKMANFTYPSFLPSATNGNLE